MSAHDASRRPAVVGPWVFDAALAVTATVAGVLVFGTMLPPASGGPRIAAGYALIVAHTLPIAVRRWFPLPVLAWALATGLGFASLGFNLVPLGLAILIYVYTVAARCRRPVSLAGLAVTEVVLVLVFLARPRALGDRTSLLGDCLAVAAAWWLGDGTRRRQEAMVAVAERAAELERAREELAKGAVVEERLRIARELHDVVAHGMSIIAVQSGVGAHVLDSQPEEARKALAAIEVTSRQALTEMRRLLGVLRQEAEPVGSLVPAPGLAEVDALAAEVAKAGARVEVRIEGTRPELPLGLDLSAYRIVQEALTNVVRHAGPATARVHIRYAPAAVDIEVTDDGRGGRVVAAKLATGVLVGLAFAAVITVVVLAVGLPWLAAKGVPIQLTGPLAQKVAGVLAAAALSGLLGVAVATLVRNQVAAVVGVLLWFLLVEGVLPPVLRAPTLPRWLPGGATAALTEPGGRYLSMWAGGLLLAGYALVLAAIGSRLTLRRDVT